jgi:hypothetical protein
LQRAEAAIARVAGAPTPFDVEKARAELDRLSALLTAA